MHLTLGISAADCDLSHGGIRQALCRSGGSGQFLHLCPRLCA